MKKRNWGALTAGVLAGLMLAGTVSAAVASISDPEPSKWSFKLDGEQINLSSVNYNGANYLKLRDFAKAMDIGVEYDGTMMARFRKSIRRRRASLTMSSALKWKCRSISTTLLTGSMQRSRHSAVCIFWRACCKAPTRLLRFRRTTRFSAKWEPWRQSSPSAIRMAGYRLRDKRSPAISICTNHWRDRKVPSVFVSMRLCCQHSFAAA